MVSAFKFIAQRKPIPIANTFDYSETKAGAIRMFCFPETIENAILVQCTPPGVADDKNVLFGLQKDMVMWL